MAGAQAAGTAEALMRARYSAYVAGNIDFIIGSTLPAARADSDPDAMRAWAEQSQWERLEILSVQGGGAGDQSGEVEFAAHYRLQDVAHRHHERSQFVREDGHWFFQDGDVIASGPAEKRRPVVNITARVGRNDPCSCGSGRKFKKCCGA
jgi:SEC-C motif-containing protein